MFRRQKSRAARRSPAPVNPALEMALAVRLKIFARATIAPAAADFLETFSRRLDEVCSRRHSVDFETAKALAWWQGPETERLVALGCTEVCGDQEIRKLMAAYAVETVVLERHVAQRLRTAIEKDGADLTLRLKALRDNRLNLQ